MSKKKKKLLQIAPRKLVTNINPKSIVSEQYRTIRTNINFSMPDKELKTLSVGRRKVEAGAGESDLAQTVHADPRRADLGADAARVGGAVPRHAHARRRRHRGGVHQPQARRGAGRGRPHRRDAPGTARGRDPQSARRRRRRSWRR